LRSRFESFTLRVGQRERYVACLLPFHNIN
jgi:hypothetical protein